MAKIQKPIKLEKNLSLKPLGHGKWEMVIYKPQKKRILYGTVTEATAEATEIYRSATAPKTNPTISEAFAQALAEGNANEETLARYTRETNKFLEWFKVAYPGVLYWKHVRPSMVQAYIDKMARKNSARDSIRLAVFPIRKTSLFWNEEHPRIFDHISRKIELPETRKTPTKALTFQQLENILEWMKENRPALYPIIALAGYMGMRLREPTGILNRDVDLEAGMIRLKSNDVRKLKNETYTPRIIPMTAKAREVVEWYMATASVKTIHPDEPLFLDETGNPWTTHHFGAYCRQVKKSMARKMELPPWFYLRRMRATFNTLLIAAGAREAYADVYQGRAPQTLGRDRYLEAEIVDMQREVVAVFDVLSGIAIPALSIDNTTETTIQQ